MFTSDRIKMVVAAALMACSGQASANNLWCSAQPPYEAGVLYPGQSIRYYASDGVNTNCFDHHLEMQADGNLVLYRDNPDGTWIAIWASNTFDTVNGWANYALLTRDGNFQVNRRNGEGDGRQEDWVLFSSGTGGHSSGSGRMAAITYHNALVLYWELNNSGQSQNIWSVEDAATPEGGNGICSALGSSRPSTHIYYSKEPTNQHYIAYWLQKDSDIECGRICAGDPQCKAFAYKPTYVHLVPELGAYKPVCFLYSWIDRLQDVNWWYDTVSGVKETVYDYLR